MRKKEQKNRIINKLVPNKELTEEVGREDIEKTYSQLINLQETFEELKRDIIITPQ